MKSSVCLLAWSLMTLACAVVSGKPTDSDVSPDPERSAEVVRIQLGALARNDVPDADAGIAVAFRFASPDNKRSTGPLDRFARIVRGEAYAPLLDHLDAEIVDVSTSLPHARVRVRVLTREGPELEYLFFLSLQGESVPSAAG